MPARTNLRGKALSLPLNTGWVGKDVDIDVPVKVALAGHWHALPGPYPVHMLVLGMRSFFVAVR